VPSSPEAWYDAWYFRHCCGRPYDRSQERYRVFGRITDRITADIGPRAVVVTDDWVDEAVLPASAHRRAREGIRWVIFIQRSGLTWCLADSNIIKYSK
jgi:hypothetical protein